jgi:hypothetical protein
METISSREDESQSNEATHADDASHWGDPDLAESRNAGACGRRYLNYVLKSMDRFELIKIIAAGPGRGVTP